LIARYTNHQKRAAINVREQDKRFGIQVAEGAAPLTKLLISTSCKKSTEPDSIHNTTWRL
jgi:hypothetical protein